MKISSDDIAKLWSSVKRGSDSECWPWLSGHNGLGYGVLYLSINGTRRAWLAHRVALALQDGHMPPSTTFALHSCDNPPCCNPKHLRWGGYSENSKDAFLRGRASIPLVRGNPVWEAKRLAAMPKGSQRPDALLSEEVVATIYRMRMDGQGPAAIAETLKLSRAMIKDVCGGKSWKHCLGINGNPTRDALKSAKVKPLHVTLDAIKAAEIRTALAAGETGRSIAKRFGVHFATVSDIKLGKAWSSI